MTPDDPTNGNHPSNHPTAHPSDQASGCSPGHPGGVGEPRAGRPPHPSAAGAASGERVVAFARELQRTTHRLGELEELVSELDGMLRQLAGDVAQLAPTDDDAEGPRTVSSWLLPTGNDDLEGASARLAGLVSWVQEVYLRYPGTELSSCWLWHPAVVEELWWLRHAHQAAFHPRSGSWREVGDWHDRLRPGVTRRISEVIGGCELYRHTPDGDQTHTTPVAPLGGAADLVAQAWLQHRATPEPSTEQLIEAEARHHARIGVHA